MLSKVYVVIVGEQGSLESWVEAVFSAKEPAYTYAAAELKKKRQRRYRPYKLWCLVEEHEVDSKEL